MMNKPLYYKALVLGGRLSSHNLVAMALLRYSLQLSGRRNNINLHNITYNTRQQVALIRTWAVTIRMMMMMMMMMMLVVVVVVMMIWVVVSNMFCFHPYLGKIPILTNILQRVQTFN